MRFNLAFLQIIKKMFQNYFDVFFKPFILLSMQTKKWTPLQIIAWMWRMAAILHIRHEAKLPPEKGVLPFGLETLGNGDRSRMSAFSAKTTFEIGISQSGNVQKV